MMKTKRNIYYYPDLNLSSYPAIMNIHEARSFAAAAKKIIDNEFGESTPVNLIGIGTSGASLMSIIAFLRNDTEIILLRKDSENTHRRSIEFRNGDGRPCIMVDDQVASGMTAQNILDATDEAGLTIQLGIFGLFDGYSESFKGDIPKIIAGRIEGAQHCKHYSE